MTRASILRAIRKDRQRRAKARHQPKDDKARSYQTQLVVFESIMKAIREGAAPGMTGQHLARFADHEAESATRKIKEIWRDE